MIFPDRILICGLGSIGSYYIRLISQNWPFIKLSILRSGKGQYYQEVQIVDNVFNSFPEALEWKPDACIISSPASCHLEQALFLAKSGIPLLIEKPVGTKIEPFSLWQELIDLNKKIPIYVAYILRSDPCSVFLKNQLESKQIGNLIEADFYCGSWLPEWRPDKDYRDSVSAHKELGGGVLFELSHEIDLALWLLGKIEIHSSILTKTGLLDLNVEDQAILMGVNSAGTSITLRLNFCTKPARRQITLRGSMGELIWDIYKGTVTCNREEDMPIVQTFSVNKDEKFKLQLEEFFIGIRGSKVFLSTLQEAVSVLMLIKKSEDIANSNIIKQP